MLGQKTSLDNCCGAIGVKGKICRFPKGEGTTHPGVGRCYMHGGIAKTENKYKGNYRTGPRTPEGKKKIPMNKRKLGLYGSVLTGADRVRYQKVQDEELGDVMLSSFHLLHARILGVMEGDAKLPRQEKTLMAAAKILQEQGELEEEFVEELRLRLLNFDVERMARVLNSSIGLAQSAVHLDRAKESEQQINIFRQAFVQILRESNDPIARQIVLSSIERLKLEAGIPTKMINNMLRRGNKPLETVEVLSSDTSALSDNLASAEALPEGSQEISDRPPEEPNQKTDPN